MAAEHCKRQPSHGKVLTLFAEWEKKKSTVIKCPQALLYFLFSFRSPISEEQDSPIPQYQHSLLACLLPHCFIFYIWIAILYMQISLSYINKCGNIKRKLNLMFVLYFTIKLLFTEAGQMFGIN